MKNILLLVYSLVIVHPQNQFSKDIEYYNLVLNYIKSTTSFSEYVERTNNNYDNIQVMEEIVPFTLIGFGFFDEIKNETGIDYDKLRFEKTFNPYYNKELINLSDKNRSRLKLFFSPIENGVIIAELKDTFKKNNDFKSATFQGSGLVYFIKIEGNEIKYSKDILIAHD